ncbi:DegT/DnrJ/EryC1/StrS family aminotransferase [Acinetobacter sp. LoGeW2-3]|uniref:DegT/DnrJ/EryC1/StrS family aminotransferase n=1 Tax=Acinetobacter sp. LoGeW2-3 TaxID=1808001 RepID=UPI001D1841F7|nr:DegT/DnrJ/EryC1/StrS family aminotransferase [Acinetobacter sp. LoGeW2-3]
MTCIARPDVDQDNYAYFPIIVKENYPLSRDELFEKFKENNIFARKYFYPIMSDLDIYANFRSDVQKAKQLSESVLCLPMYPTLSLDQCELIVDIMKGN